MPVDDYKVNIETCAIYEQGAGLRRLDPQGLSAVSKMVTDGLVDAGILVNDSPLYVHQSIEGPCAWGDENRIEVRIIEGVAPPE